MLDGKLPNAAGGFLTTLTTTPQLQPVPPSRTLTSSENKLLLAIAEGKNIWGQMRTDKDDV